MFFDNYRLIAPLQPQNRRANTQMWQAIAINRPQKVVIKQLLPNYTPLQYQQFIQEHQVYQQLNRFKLLTNPQKSYFFNLKTACISKEKPHQGNAQGNQQDNAQKNYLVFSHYQGQTLAQAVTKNQLTFQQKIAYLIELCHAINALHAQGFLHCDIKPSNILITPPHLKLFDFGLVKSIGAMPNATLTAGTPAYMSPEQLTGTIISPQSDYYSLGIVIYETLLGQKPFTATTLQGWAIQHCQSPLPKLTADTPQMTQGLQHLFSQLLAKLPHNRPQSLSPIVALLSNLQKLSK